MAAPRPVSVALALLACLASGCSTHRIDLEGPPALVDYTGDRPLTVTVLDHRPCILMYQKPLNYVGTIRGPHGRPSDQTTESGEPFADHVLRTVTESLQAKGFPVTPVSHKPEDPLNAVLGEFRASGTDRLLVITIREWQSDYYPPDFASESSYVLYDLEMEVFGTNRDVVARNTVSGDSHLPPGWPDTTVPVFFRAKLGELLNAPGIEAALK